MATTAKRQKRIQVILPIKTVSLNNRREHWSKRQRRARTERLVTVGMLNVHRSPRGPWLVELTRWGQRELDDDNLRGSLKSIRDAVAGWLGVDDKDPRVKFAYSQIVDRKTNPAVVVRITERGLMD